jgi:hypothetical protein
MATRRQCEQAIKQLATALSRIDPEFRRQRLPARDVALVVSDLDLAFSGRIDGEGLHDVAAVSIDDVQGVPVRFTASSDDVVAIGRRPASFPTAWVRGRVRVHAGLRDLIELRRLL